jgi:hypothetical protein
MDFPGPVMWYPMGYPAGNHSVLDNSNHTFSAVADPGFVFQNFTITDGSTTMTWNATSSVNIVVITAFNITAYFLPIGGPLVYITTVDTVGGALFLDYGEAGTPAATVVMPAGVVHSFSAFPQTGYVFRNFTVTIGGITSTYFTNPFLMTVNDNVTVTAYYSLEAVTPSPTATPNPGMDWGTFRTDMTAIIEIIIGSILTFLGILILMRAPGAWLVGVILIVAGFFTQYVANTNMVGIVGFSLQTTVYIIFLYNAGKGRGSK